MTEWLRSYHHPIILGGPRPTPTRPHSPIPGSGHAGLSPHGPGADAPWDPLGSTGYSASSGVPLPVLSRQRGAAVKPSPANRPNRPQSRTAPPHPGCQLCSVSAHLHSLSDAPHSQRAHSPPHSGQTPLVPWQGGSLQHMKCTGLLRRSNTISARTSGSSSRYLSMCHSSETNRSTIGRG